MTTERRIAYFSMEIALSEELPTYAGGLGVLAGDTIRSAADLRVPMVAVTLLHRKGYFDQRLDADGWQSEQPAEWSPERHLVEQPPRVSVEIEARTVQLRAWRYEVAGVGQFVVPVYLLDTDIAENGEWDRKLTDTLYGGDDHYRLCQEVVLGMGGVRMLQALGYAKLQRYHMNEGHSSLLALELLDEHVAAAGRTQSNRDDVIAVHDKCVFTTHTPVPAGHDRFSQEMAERVLGSALNSHDQDIYSHDGRLNMTYLALNLSHYVNGVAKKHGEVSRHMFAKYQIDSITNGVHAATWTTRPFQQLFDQHIPGWREDNFNLRYALSIPHNEILETHGRAKKALVEYVNRETNAGFNEDVLTLGFARRAATYKRPGLLLEDAERLLELSRKHALQLVFAGKAHPRDQTGKKLIQHVFQQAKQLRPSVNLVFLPNYDMRLGLLITSGVDVWLNTPQPPLEASGTSGMKAALNGVPSLSVLDGWWIEGCIEGVTGWGIGERQRDERPHECAENDACSLYGKLEDVVLPLFCRDRDGFAEVMRHAIALNGSFFNTQRMMQQYVLKAYFP
ncbi:Maltodextrin phosphorylase [Bremerella volcania]|uniref:glycogen phosphorylase n=1 Tax=Bremerella volcania TaxID=2527984 RepID=A0A518C5R1_9BACT|nr:alpha-glucan family phosphorylase [Bremerella volcania]QDU74551.1 Maltodextrin phosphorylase [Bremerella volcania]